MEDVYNFLNNTSNYYEMPMEIQLKKNENTLQFFQLIRNTLESLAVPESEGGHYIRISFPYLGESIGNYEPPIYLRSADKDLQEWGVRLRATILNELSDFVMIDNLGGKSYFNDDDMLSYIEEKRRGRFNGSHIESYSPKYCYTSNSKWHIANGGGLFSPLVLFRFNSIREKGRAENGNLTDIFDMLHYYGEDTSFNQNMTLYISLYIPKDKIMEYNNFTLERKTN